MTETSTLEAAPPVADEPTGTKRTALVAGGLAAAVALAGGGYFLLSGGSSDPVSSGPVALPKPAAVQPAAKAAAKKPAAAKPATLPNTSTVRLGRDPFKALYVQPAAAPAAATTTTPTSTQPASTTTTPTTTPAKPVATTYPMRLVSVYGSGAGSTAVFSVAGKQQTAKPGSVFGRTAELKLLSLQQNAKGVWTAVVQVGDGDPFDAPTGQTLYVM
ncbi:MAG: hypothetical protein WCD35_02460 [Mycobacteriales bacterium]